MWNVWRGSIVGVMMWKSHPVQTMYPGTDAFFCPCPTPANSTFIPKLIRYVFDTGFGPLVSKSFDINRFF